MKGVLQIVIKVLCLLVGIASFAYVIAINTSSWEWELSSPCSADCLIW